MVLGYDVIDQGRCFSQNEQEDEYLSDKRKSCSHGYIGCGLGNLDKRVRGEWLN